LNIAITDRRPTSHNKRLEVANGPEFYVYLKIQFVTRSKHTLSQLGKSVN